MQGFRQLCGACRIHFELSGIKSKKVKKIEKIFKKGIAKLKDLWYNVKALSKARWSSGQDASLSRWKRGFDSPTGHQKRKHFERSAFLFLVNEAHLRCMKNEAAFGYEECLTIHGERESALRFMRVQRVLHIGVSQCFIFH